MTGSILLVWGVGGTELAVNDGEGNGEWKEDCKREVQEG